MRLTTADIGIEGKIFCLSMQRTGTSSIGDFLEQFGLSRVGSQISNKSRWPHHWLAGNFDAILDDPQFIEADVLEDDPWWFPEFYKFAYHKFPGSRFILLERDSDSWFRSMISHSNGYSLGNTKIHAKIYRREPEYHWLLDNVPKFGSNRTQEMILFDKPQHYMDVYKLHNREVKSFFGAVAPNQFFTANLADKELWKNLTVWLNLPQTGEQADSMHSHKRKSEFTQEHLLVKRG